jgi:urea transport system ATP-binding protein
MAFGGVRAVDGVGFNLACGAMIAVIGPNGCGKTTLFNLITGVLRPTGGSILFEGQRIDRMPPVDIARAGIVRKFQVPSVFPGMTVADNVAVAAAARATDPASPAAILDLVGLATLSRRDAGTLSHGEKQWLELALVLATRPKLVLLDEPAAGMTRAEKSRTVELIARVRSETRVALIVIEHDMTFVGALECPVKAMMAGRILAEGSLDMVKGDQRVREGYLGRKVVVHG